MALDWTDKIDGQDIVAANDVNSIAHAVTELEGKIGIIYKVKGSKTVAEINALTGMEIGDVYNVSTSGQIGVDLLDIKVSGNDMYFPADATSYDDKIWADGIYVSNHSLDSFIDVGTVITTNDDVYTITSVVARNVKSNYTQEVLIDYFKCTTESGGNPYRRTDRSGVLSISGYSVFNVLAGDNIVFTADGWDKLSSDVDLSNYYTKSEIDSKLASVYRVCGSATVAEIIAMTEQNVGDVYNVSDSGTIPEIELTFSDLEIVTDDYCALKDGTYLTGEFYYLYGTDAETISAQIDNSSQITVTDGDYEATTSTIFVPNTYRNFKRYWNKISGDAEFVYDYHEVHYDVTKVVKNPAIELLAGDNIVWVGDHWDKLAATVDVSAIIGEAIGGAY